MPRRSRAASARQASTFPRKRSPLFEFLWDALARSGGRSIQFGCVDEDDKLWAIYMDRDCVGYVASAPIKKVDGGIRLGDWKIERMPRSDE